MLNRLFNNYYCDKIIILYRKGYGNWKHLNCNLAKKEETEFINPQYKKWMQYGTVINCNS